MPSGIIKDKLGVDFKLTPENVLMNSITDPEQFSMAFFIMRLVGFGLRCLWLRIGLLYQPVITINIILPPRKEAANLFLSKCTIEPRFRHHPKGVPNASCNK